MSISVIFRRYESCAVVCVDARVVTLVIVFIPSYTKVLEVRLKKQHVSEKTHRRRCCVGAACVVNDGETDKHTYRHC